MRGIHSVVDDLRRQVFTEVARLAYEGGDYLAHRRPALQNHPRRGRPATATTSSWSAPSSASGCAWPAACPCAPAAEHEPRLATASRRPHRPKSTMSRPLINIIPFACNACPPKEIRVSSNCQGCLSHPCMNVCPKGAIYHRTRRQERTLTSPSASSAAAAPSQCPYNAISQHRAPLRRRLRHGRHRLRRAAAAPRSTTTSASPAACAW